MEIPKETPWKIAENRTLKWVQVPPGAKPYYASDLLSITYTA
jgi:hypothetical protein